MTTNNFGKQDYLQICIIKCLMFMLSLCFENSLWSAKLLNLFCEKDLWVPSGFYFRKRKGEFIHRKKNCIVHFMHSTQVLGLIYKQIRIFSLNTHTYTFVTSFPQIFNAYLLLAYIRLLIKGKVVILITNQILICLISRLPR